MSFKVTSLQLRPLKNGRKNFVKIITRTFLNIKVKILKVAQYNLVINEPSGSGGTINL